MAFNHLKYLALHVTSYTIHVYFAPGGGLVGPIIKGLTVGPKNLFEPPSFKYVDVEIGELETLEDPSKGLVTGNFNACS